MEITIKTAGTVNFDVATTAYVFCCQTQERRTFEMAKVTIRKIEEN